MELGVDEAYEAACRAEVAVFGSEGRAGEEVDSEVARNSCLPCERRLSREKVRLLLDRSWQAPDRTAPSFSFIWLAGTDDDRLAVAEEVLWVLEEMYGVRQEERLVIEVFGEMG